MIHKLLPRQNKNKRSVIITATAVLSLAVIIMGCNQSTIYHNFHKIADNGWLRTDTICFDVALTDSQATSKLFIQLRTTNEYQYSDLALGVAVEKNDSAVTSAQTIRMNLANDKGEWTGRNYGWLNVYETHAEDLTTNKPDTYRIKLYSMFLDSLLTGISDIGLRIERSTD